MMSSDLLALSDVCPRNLQFGAEGELVLFNRSFGSPSLATTTVLKVEFALHLSMCSTLINT